MSAWNRTASLGAAAVFASMAAVAAGGCTAPPASAAPPVAQPAPVPTQPPAAALAPIETRGGVTVISSLALRCPTGGPRPFARLIASDEAAGLRLAAVGVDAAVRERLKAMKIDWAAGERLLLVYGGSAPNPGYGLVIDAIGRPDSQGDDPKAVPGDLQVRAHLTQPEPGQLYAQVIVNPCRLIHLRDPAAARGSDEVEFRFEP